MQPQLKNDGIKTLIEANLNTGKKFDKKKCRRAILLYFLYHTSHEACHLQFRTICLRFNGEFAHREDALFLELFRRPNAQLVFGQSSTHRARLLGPQVLRHVTALLVELAEVLLLRLVDDGQNASYRLAYHATAQNPQRVVTAGSTTALTNCNVSAVTTASATFHNQCQDRFKLSYVV